ncbi:MAG: Crp/Fnr family transcriptional regulator [Fervidobacterium sp.]
MKMEERKNILEKLSKCEVFQNLEDSFIVEIVSNGQIEHYEAKEIVRRRGEKCEEVLVLIDGEAYGLFVNAEGRVLQIDHMIAPKILASAVIFSTDPKYPVDVETAKRSTFLRIEKDKFLKYMLKSEKLLRNYLKYMSDAFLFITDRFYEISMKNLVQKVCTYIVNLIDSQNSDIILMDMTKEELSREFGVTRPALSRVFIELEKAGVIEVYGRKLHVRNKKFLRDYSEFG